MPVLDRPEIKKEDLGALAQSFTDDENTVVNPIPVAFFYLQKGTLCVESADYTRLVIAPQREIQKYVDGVKFAAIYDSTGEDGTHRIAVYEKSKDQNQYFRIPNKNTPALDQAS